LKPKIPRTICLYDGSPCLTVDDLHPLVLPQHRNEITDSAHAEASPEYSGRAARDRPQNHHPFQKPSDQNQSRRLRNHRRRHGLVNQDAEPDSQVRLPPHRRSIAWRNIRRATILTTSAVSIRDIAMGGEKKHPCGERL